MEIKKDLSFYKGKKVLLTGHTGFKGSWMCELLLSLGAEVTGYAMNPPTTPSLFDLCHLQDRMHSVIGDVRDLQKMLAVFQEVKPEIVIHMAAQPIVRESYKDPVYTYETNVMGTVNVLECVRLTDSVKSFLNVTTDKVYLNKEWTWGYRENEELNGFDPYSNSKSCSELVTASYRNAFFMNREIAVSTARAGNVIGGGDFAPDRIIPDCVRAAERKEDIIVRNPYSTRPYQHVLEPVYVYLLIAMNQYGQKSLESSYNVGPDDCDCLNTGSLTTMFCEKWNACTDSRMKWINKHDGGPHEANYLKLDCSKLKSVFAWKPICNIDRCMDTIVEWYDAYLSGNDMQKCTDKQIQNMLADLL